MNVSTKSLQIVIPYYNGAQFIKPLLKSIESSTKSGGIKIKVTIVDNSEIPLVLNSISAGFSFETELIRTRQSNIGYARACNVGIKYVSQSHYDYIMFLNQDTLLQSDCLYHLVSTVCQSLDPNVIYSPKIFIDTDFQHPLDYIKSAGDTTNDNEKMIEEINFIQGCCYLMSRKTLSLLAFFDPIFPFFGEDMDMIKRLNKKGGKLYIVHRARLYHRISYLALSRNEKAIRSALLHIAKVINDSRHNQKTWFIAICYFFADLMRALRSKSFKVFYQIFNKYLIFFTSIPLISSSRSSDIRKRAMHHLAKDIHLESLNISTS